MDYILELLAGPGAFRFVIQPILAILMGARDGLTGGSIERVAILQYCAASPMEIRKRAFGLMDAQLPGAP